MTENEFTASPYRDAMIAHRARLQALEMCAATSLGDQQAIRDICESELRNGGTDFMAALAQLAVQLAVTVAARDGVTEADVWAFLTEQTSTAVIATAEMDQMTRTPNSKEDSGDDS
ncbi:Uncharacterised protein [Mycobacteroides abscessus]|uniref:hypothetical protein n=1 Tax=Mycobacteroides abscessus TaxID=36809 RepID=UPI0005E0A24B|nr:hypothetical protein [Mycobacteroides abscessus]PVB14465.1 hypothetical protein DDJ68_13230 [Mycobacteroides abscessus]RIR93469.1 hypothetical protein D2E57_13510 [Mycobacteroides abscessus]CPX22352.1 Uncharacterised protein [Mycobacteroides abscessus]CRG62196.1 Uncharacterised protein [Mycobacteroides abscessus]SKZ74086.1 Uncharacterised protein [Mycobacteroides abscessus subsp. abscessus]